MIRVERNWTKRLQSTTQSGQKHFNSRFYFDPNSVNIAARDGVYIYAASSGSLWAACAFLEQQGDYYSLSLCGVNDPGGWFEGSPVLIVDEWQAASAPGANDGFLSLWIDGVLAGTISNVDNDTHALDEVRLGATGGVDSSTSGSMFFDSFESQRETYIGP